MDVLSVGTSVAIRAASIAIRPGAVRYGSNGVGGYVRREGQLDRGSFLRNAATAIALVLAVAILAAAPVEIAAATQQDSGSPGEPVDINRASVDELIGLPGIGEVMAKRIIEFREQHGPFKRVEDLLKVKGIGEKSFQKLRPSITVSRADSE